ncbi:MAG: response regulator [Planctomycetes bacterium]|nr:response regulator [Planctomycetota bacterium]
MNNKESILLVDDEQAVLDGLRLLLRKKYNVTAVNSGAAGLECLEEDVDYSVIVSDMRMPEMNGAEFLCRARGVTPYATRILLTGYSDIETAVIAINDGQIFRFLTKPCDAHTFLKAINDACMQHRLLCAKDILLEKTLNGSISALTDLMAFAMPRAFGRAMRIKYIAYQMAKNMGHELHWWMDTACVFSQVSLNDIDYAKDRWSIILEKVNGFPAKGRVDSIVEMLMQVPHLEVVAELINSLFNECNRKIEADILRVAMAYDDYVIRPSERDALMGVLLKWNIDKKLNDAISSVNIEKDLKYFIVDCSLSEVSSGMLIKKDVFTDDGTLLLSKGFEITRGVEEKLKLYACQVTERVQVYKLKNEGNNHG